MSSKVRKREIPKPTRAAAGSVGDMDMDEIDPANIVSTDNDDLEALFSYSEDEDDEESGQTRKAHPAPSLAMFKEAEKLAAQAEKAYEKVNRQKAKEALKNELNMAERKRSPRKSHSAPSLAMLKEAEKLSKQAFKLHENAKKQKAKETVAAAAADAKDAAAYVTQLEKELVKARAAVKKTAAKLETVRRSFARSPAKSATPRKGKGAKGRRGKHTGGGGGG